MADPVKQISETIKTFDDLERAVDDLLGGAAKTSTWRGRTIWKNPADLMIYAEIIQDVRPTLVIECGTHHGGSALWWRDMLRLLSNPRAHVISIDEVLHGTRLNEKGIVTLLGSSLDDDIFEVVAAEAARHQRVLVNLDSAHTYENVRAELERYHPLVTLGSYLIVEDGIDDFRLNVTGPFAACRDFLSAHPEFERDLHRERFGITNCVGGFLKRYR